MSRTLNSHRHEYLLICYQWFVSDVMQQYNERLFFHGTYEQWSSPELAIMMTAEALTDDQIVRVESPWEKWTLLDLASVKRSSLLSPPSPFLPSHHDLPRILCPRCPLHSLCSGSRHSRIHLSSFYPSDGYRSNTLWEHYSSEFSRPASDRDSCKSRWDLTKLWVNLVYFFFSSPLLQFGIW